MKVFVRANDLASGKRPDVVAFYDDTVDISADAHGPGMTIITVPPHVISMPSSKFDGVPSTEPPRLVANWRELVGSRIVNAEAEHRINDVFMPSEQIGALREVVELIVEYGPDVSKWPSDARTRKSEIDAKWNYVGEIRERARAHTSHVPVDASSDKAWPARIKK